MGGSVEVLTDILGKLSNEKVKIKYRTPASAPSPSPTFCWRQRRTPSVIGFNVRPERKAQELAEQEKVDIRLHSIIYELQDEMKRAMTGLLDPIVQGNLPWPRRSH